MPSAAVRQQASIPTGPTHPGQPFSHSHEAISFGAFEQLVVHAIQRLADSAQGSCRHKIICGRFAVPSASSSDAIEMPMSTIAHQGNCATCCIARRVPRCRHGDHRTRMAAHP
jgi:hypothetical protein